MPRTRRSTPGWRARARRVGALLLLPCSAAGAAPGVAPGVGSQAPGPAADAPETARELAQIEALLAGAHFRTALAVADRTREHVESEGAPAASPEERARLEVMAATAEIALGRSAAARESMDRALRADPTLQLDEDETSPRVLDVLRAARHRAGSPEPTP